MSSFSSCQVVMSLNSNYAVLGTLNKLSYQKVEFRSEKSGHTKWQYVFYLGIVNSKTVFIKKY